MVLLNIPKYIKKKKTMSIGRFKYGTRVYYALKSPKNKD